MTVEPALEAVEIGRANAHDLRIRWADGHVSTYASAALRLACPCASCVQLAASRARSALRMLPSGIESIRPLRIELTGTFGLRVHWSDGHSHGLYGFALLRAMCPCCRDPLRPGGNPTSPRGDRT